MTEVEMSKAAHLFPQVVKRHDEFLKLLEASAARAPLENCSWQFEDGKVTATIYGREIAATSRPIFYNGELAHEEWAFAVEWQEKPSVLLILSLERNMGLYELSAGLPGTSPRDAFCWADNDYVSAQLLARIAGELFRSPVFAPSVVA